MQKKECPIGPGWSLWAPCPICGALGPWFENGECVDEKRDARLSDALGANQQARPTRITGATDIVDEAACLIWSELCPDTVMGDEDRPYYEAAAKAVLALSSHAREAVIEECAKVCEGLRHVDYPSETSEWSSGTFDCAQAVRALRTGK